VTVEVAAEVLSGGIADALLQTHHFHELLCLLREIYMNN
jgi:hypothetical protein